MPIAIDIQNLSKRYKIYRSPRARLEEWLSLGRSIQHTEFWALKNFNLQVKQGECVGILGPNGAGKSTLLKLLSQTITPTHGSFRIRGKVLSLLELGTGFNPELTGRQNIIETASLLGFPTGYVQEQMHEILAFSDLGEFIDRPIKTYSSGMTVRLAFSMFVFLKPDVFIIDEALAVGDVGFQRACYRKIEQMLASGVTCLLVTHDFNAVIQFCNRALLLVHGEKVFEGEPRQAVNRINNLFFGIATESADDQNLGDGSATITQIWVENSLAQRITNARSNQPIEFCYSVEFHQDTADIDFGFHIKTVHGIEVTGIGSEKIGDSFGPFNAGQTATVWKLSMHLNPGTYFFGCGVRNHINNSFLTRRVDALKFPIADISVAGGIINPVREITVELQSAAMETL